MNYKYIDTSQINVRLKNYLHFSPMYTPVDIGE